MRIQYNQGIFTQNRYTQTNTELNTTLNKLASGMKINRAADDAAGLSISEKMRAQIRGLQQASENTQDAISLIQTADGALGNIVNPNLQRLRELAVQAANDTLTNDDRLLMQKEIDQIVQGIDDIAYHTEFNSMKLLTGITNEDGDSKPTSSLTDYVQDVTTTGGITDNYTYGGNTYASAVIDFSNITTADDIANLVGKGVNYTCCTCTKAYSIKFINGAPNTSRLNDYNPVLEVDVSTLSSGTDLANKIVETAYGQPGFVHNPITPNLPSTATSFVDHFSQLAVDGAKLYMYDNRPENANKTWPENGHGTFELNVYGENEEENLFLHLVMQVGSNSSQNVKVSIPNVTAAKLKIDSLSINTQAKANSAISIIDDAILKVSNARATMGAYQNRFEHTFNNVKNAAENLTRSESQLRDTDMAKEITILKKNQILLQSSQSMLAQVNQMSQNILKILG